MFPTLLLERLVAQVVQYFTQLKGSEPSGTTCLEQKTVVGSF